MSGRVRLLTSSSRIARRLLLITLAVVASIAFSRSATAQAVYGSIAGTVSDPSGGVLPGVTVTVTSLERKTLDTVVTNETGQYVKERLLPGRYEVKVELSGFKQIVYPDIQVGVDSQTRLDVRLQVGALSEAVTVQGYSPILKTDRADVATTFDSKQITDLPVLDRNFTKFVLLTPGTQQLGWQHAASENPQGSTQTMVNGQHFSGTGYQLDGTENRDPILGIIVINPTLESIAETKITSQNYDAEFGQATAGVVSVQTKSGANELRGSGFWFYQNESLQARNPFTQFQTRSADWRVPARHEQDPAGLLRGRAHRSEQVVFLRRLRGDAQHRRRLAARLRAHGGGAPRRFQPVWREHLRSGERRARRASAVRRQRDSHRTSLAAGARAPAARADAEPARTRERHDRQLRGLGVGDLRRQLVQPPHRRTAPRRAQHLRTLQPRGLPARRPAGLRTRGRRRRARDARRRLRRPQPEPRVWRRLGVLLDAPRRLPVRMVQLPRQRAAVGLRNDARRRRPAYPASTSTRRSHRACLQSSSAAMATAGASRSVRGSAIAWDGATVRSIRTRSSSRSSATSRSSSAATP